VRPHGFDADRQLVGDPGVGVALLEQLEDVGLTSGEQVGLGQLQPVGRPRRGG
jgi:hypothetical protein